jgi:rhamnose utilization protein RhaD (predicted bifunctional aldolase and dehydrogenase)
MNFIQKKINHLCSQLGKDHLIVQGAGGNVSWKDKEILWIKASGTWLAQANEKNIFVPVNLIDIKNKISKNDFKITIKNLDQSHLKPSIETILHIVMPQKFVVHLHPVNIFTRMLQKDIGWLNKIQDHFLFKNFLVLDYVQPGATLARLLHQNIDIKKNEKLIFLKNHGIIYGADDLDELNDALEELFSIFKIDPEVNQFKKISQKRLGFVLSGNQYSPIQSNTLNQLVMDNNLYDLIEENWAICPDHIVFLGEQAYCFDKLPVSENEIHAIPQVIFVKNQGIYVREDWKSSQEAQLQFFYEVLRRLPKKTKISLLEKSEINKLLDWDQETYRKNLKN